MVLINLSEAPEREFPEKQDEQFFGLSIYASTCLLPF